MQVRAMDQAKSPNRRLARERKTIHRMIALYCRAHHDTSRGRPICPDCQSLAAYAFERIDRCPSSMRKPQCATCPIHCYNPAMRESVRAVMRHAGPRMMLGR